MSPIYLSERAGQNYTDFLLARPGDDDGLVLADLLKTKETNWPSLNDFLYQNARPVGEGAEIRESC